MREDQRLDNSQWGERGRSYARRKAAVSATEQLNGDPQDSLNMECVRCSRCGKRVSQYVTVQGGRAPLLVRAWVECPECVRS